MKEILGEGTLVKREREKKTHNYMKKLFSYYYDVNWQFLPRNTIKTVFVYFLEFFLVSTYIKDWLVLVCGRVKDVLTSDIQQYQYLLLLVNILNNYTIVCK